MLHMRTGQKKTVSTCPQELLIPCSNSLEMEFNYSYSSVLLPSTSGMNCLDSGPAVQFHENGSLCTLKVPLLSVGAYMGTGVYWHRSDCRVLVEHSTMILVSATWILALTMFRAAPLKVSLQLWELF